ncbi:hypothetical protein SPSYN_02520 [Sporotomaculum syntrophicum]|uniref:HTH cro/C1-type domain-containing protein n=1 Tax=Sporotomaculum syntrophicum TaxID=182264 RepID=A0A9D3AYF0_9FIRM|nr:helix-turn-helix transcriptional regulator [Sporotomaculum syntrophicum]KAF1084734.1 hypothetical protein SPSYN_02520 [Sporotomaculum syntrophicum]
MNIIRVGDKVLNTDRIHRMVDQILQLRHEGLSQQEVADRLGVDRTLVSRLEGLGEIRKGPQVAVIGFPLANARELTEVAQAGGVDFILLMTEEERCNFVQEQNGAALINYIMDVFSQIKSYDSVIFIGSDMRIKMVEAILGPKIIGWEIGISPIKKDCWIDPEQLHKLILHLKNAG